MKYATTLDEQVDKLKNRGLVINDEEKTKEVKELTKKFPIYKK